MSGKSQSREDQVTRPEDVAELVKYRRGPDLDPFRLNPEPLPFEAVKIHWFFSQTKAAFPQFEYPYNEQAMVLRAPMQPPENMLDGRMPAVEFDSPGQSRALYLQRPNPSPAWIKTMTQADKGSFTSFAFVKQLLHKGAKGMLKPRVDMALLSFEQPCSSSALETSAEAVLKNAKWHDKRGDSAEAAYLYLLHLNHQVIVLDGRHAYDAKLEASRNFPEYIFGPWEPMQGDVVILPDLHGSPTTCQWILAAAQLALKQINKLPGSFKDFYKIHIVTYDEISDTQWYENEFLDSESLELRRLSEATSVKNAPVKNLTFRPTFSKYFFRLHSVKARLAVEVLQVTIIALLKAVDAALLRRDYGGALYLVQLLRYGIVLFSWLLRYKPLQASYIFGLYKFFEGKCYGHCFFNSNVRERYLEVKNVFKGAEKTFHVFEKEFLDDLKNTGNESMIHEIGINLPFSRLNCLATSFQGFFGVALSPAWKRAWLHKEVVAVTYLKKHLHYWKFCTVTDYMPGSYSPRSYHLFMIGCHLKRAVEEQNLSHLGRAALMLLQANFFQLKEAWQMSSSRDLTVSPIHEVFFVNISSSHSCNQRSINTRSAVLELAELATEPSLQQPPMSPKELREIFVHVAVEVFCSQAMEELLHHEWQDQHLDSAFQGLYNMMELLRHCLGPWLRSSSDAGSLTYGLVVPHDEEMLVDQMFGLLFYATSLIYYRIVGFSPITETQREVYLNNATYYLALSMAYIVRPGVTWAVLSRFSDLALTYDRCLIQVAMKNQPCVVARATTVLSIHVQMLPLLWELCIRSCEDDNGPRNYKETRILSACLPLSFSEIEREFSKPDESAFFKFLSQYVTEDVGVFRKPIILRGYPSDPKPTPREMVRLPHNSYGRAPYFWNFSAEKTEGEKRPFVPSRFPCGTYQEVEKHLEISERDASKSSKFFTLELFETITANFSGKKSACGVSDTLEEAAKDIMANVQFLCNRIKDTLDENPATVFRKRPRRVGIPHSEVLTAVRMPNLFKNQPTSALLCLTRTLARLDKVLFGGVLLSLMRGEID